MATEAATAKNGQFVLVFTLPDVCLTPDKAGYPVPYPITHTMDLSEQCSPNVFFAGCPAFMHNQSYVDTVHGDEPGEGKGMGIGLRRERRALTAPTGIAAAVYAHGYSSYYFDSYLPVPSMDFIYF